MNTITKFIAAIIFSLLIFSTPQKIFAAAMKSAGWPDAGVVWTTAISTNYLVDSYWTNFPNYSSAASMNNSAPMPSFDKHLSKKELKLMKRVEKRIGKIQKRMNSKNAMTSSSNFNPGWPTEFGPYCEGGAYKWGNNYTSIIPAGMYIDGEDYFIVYNVISKSNSTEMLGENRYWWGPGAIYDWLSNNDYKTIFWYKGIYTQSSQSYVQKIDKSGNTVSDLGIPIISRADYKNYEFYYRREHYTNGNWYTLHYESTNYVNGSIDGASLVDCGKNLLISGQRTRPGKSWRAPPEVIDGGIYYVTKNNTLEKLEWPSWCSGKFVGLSSGHKTSGRENKYIHAFGGDSGKRVWRLLPR